MQCRHSRLSSPLFEAVTSKERLLTGTKAQQKSRVDGCNNTGQFPVGPTITRLKLAKWPPGPVLIGWV